MALAPSTTALQFEPVIVRWMPVIVPLVVRDEAV
jgi:hypothetical protein